MHFWVNGYKNCSKDYLQQLTNWIVCRKKIFFQRISNRHVNIQSHYYKNNNPLAAPKKLWIQVFSSKHQISCAQKGIIKNLYLYTKDPAYSKPQKVIISFGRKVQGEQCISWQKQLTRNSLGTKTPPLSSTFNQRSNKLEGFV